MRKRFAFRPLGAIALALCAGWLMTGCTASSETRKMIALQTIGDNTYERDERFYLFVDNAQNARPIELALRIEVPNDD